MDFSARSIWELTKLFVRDPAEASRRILAANLPVNVSVLMLVLSGVVSGLMAAVSVMLFGPQTVTMQLPDGTEQTLQQASPILTGVTSALAGLGFSYLVYWVGKRSGGTGTLPEVLSVMASVQIALTVLGVATVVLDLLIPFVGFALALLVIYISLRAIGHGVRESHRFDGMGRAIMVILASVIILVIGFMILTAVFGPALIGDVQNDV